MRVGHWICNTIGRVVRRRIEKRDRRRRGGGEALPGLSALNRSTILPFGLTIKVSLLIGNSGIVSLFTYTPASSSLLTTAWNSCPCRWKGCFPGSKLFSTISTTSPCPNTNAFVLLPYTPTSVAISPVVRAEYRVGTFGRV